MSTTTAADHTFWYKILSAAPPHPLPATLPTTELDARDNFIHLSTASQIPITLDRFFAAAATVWILKVRRRDIDGEIRFEEGLPECPHVHDTERGLGSGNVDEVIVVTRAEGESWGEVKEVKGLVSD